MFGVGWARELVMETRKMGAEREERRGERSGWARSRRLRQEGSRVGWWGRAVGGTVFN